MDVPSPLELRATVPTRAISLKWKTLALLAVALALVHATLVLLDYREQLTESVQRQGAELEQKLHILDRLLQQSAERLQRIGTIVPAIVDALPPDADIEERWTALQLDLDLQALLLYDRQGAALASGLPYFRTSTPALLKEAVQLALQEERPRNLILCELSCVQLALTPTLNAEGDPRVMVVGTGLAEIVIRFPQLTGADLALITPHAQRNRPSPPLRDGRYLVAVSNAPHNEPRLRAEAESRDLVAAREGTSFVAEGRSYRATSRPLSGFGGLDGGDFLIFTDISEDLRQIRSQFRRAFATGLSAMVVALMLGLLVLNRPMNKLRKLADALPLLANKNYSAARQLIGQEHEGSRLPTEIEVLEGVAFDLTHRLEELEGLVDVRNRALAEKISELQRSQELNEKIFATSPILMLMLSGEGQVVRVNEFACTLLGYSPAEFRDRRFAELIIDERKRKQAASAIIDLVSGRRPVFEQTSFVACVDGSSEAITWMHTRVTTQSGLFVLSLGLPDKIDSGEPDLDQEPEGMRSS